MMVSTIVARAVQSGRQIRKKRHHSKRSDAGVQDILRSASQHLVHDLGSLGKCFAWQMVFDDHTPCDWRGADTPQVD